MLKCRGRRANYGAQFEVMMFNTSLFSFVNGLVLTDSRRVPDGTAPPGGGRPEFRLDAIPSGSEKAENAARFAARRALLL